MDRREGVDSSCRNTIRTDLSLLLECLKFQMKSPDLQKQALLTIQSICEKKEHNVELLREMGGVAFLLNLSKSSIVESDVKETALFTLGIMAEANVYCKNSLCRKEIFTDLADWLVKDDASLTKKRVIVFFLSVLVTNNKLGQTLAQNTSCLDVLLSLFRATFPLSAEGTFKTTYSTQLHQLWSSVSSALCGCVNNPHNEEGQRACITVFPTVKNWIQQISLPQIEIFQPICSFISMTVANNSRVQESFAASGGLENLTLALIRFCLGSETSLLSCQLAVSISKTLSACISDNSAIASDLAKYELVCHLFSLLINPKLDSEDRLSVLLTMGHCTEASEEHQKQLMQIGSLPVFITLLTEDPSEEVRKAATFILQTCKQATNAVGIPDVKEAIGKDEFTNTKTCRRFSKVLLQRIDLLEKRQAESERELLYPQLIPEKSACPFVAGSAEEEDCENDEEPIVVRVNRNLRSTKMKKSPEEPSKTLWPPFIRTGSVSYGRRLEGAREPQENSEQLKAVVPQRQNIPKEEDLYNEVKNPGEEGSVSEVRCTGCVLRFDEVNSRTFTSLQSSCAHSCDMHKVLKDTMEHYMSLHRRLFTRQERPPSIQQLTNPSSENVQAHKNQKNWRGVTLTPIRRAGQVNRFQTADQREKHKVVRLTPLHKGMKMEGPASFQRAGSVLSHFKRPHRSEKNNQKNKRKPSPDDGQMETETSSSLTSQRRKRQDFSREEELYLQCGVKTYGPSWNAILWSYPFQPGRTNVDLAKKYSRQMKKSKTQEEGLA